MEGALYRGLWRFVRGLVAVLLAAAIAYAVGFLSQNDLGLDKALITLLIALLQALGKYLRDRERIPDWIPL